ncbi:MAG: hypothetical protein ACLUOF_10330 [Ruminococcus sp.]
MQKYIRRIPSEHHTYASTTTTTTVMTTTPSHHYSDNGHYGRPRHPPQKVRRP